MEKIKFDKKAIIKTGIKVIVGGVVSIGAGMVVEKLGASALIGETNKFKKVVMFIGLTGLGAAAGAAAGAAVEEQVDAFMTGVEIGNNLTDAFVNRVNKEGNV